jgi:hypothetical protein
VAIEISAPNWRAEDGHHIDVRGLGPPQPMVQILILLESIGGGNAVAHLDREPVYLYPELVEMGWNYELLPSDSDAANDSGINNEDTHVRLRLWKD